MPGQLVRDYESYKLFEKEKISTATTTTGDAVEVLFPGMVRIELAVSEFTGTNPTLDVEVQASDDDSFSSPVSLGRFTRVTSSNDEQSHWINAYSNYRFMRAVAVTGGTSPEVTITVELHPPHQDRTPGN